MKWFSNTKPEVISEVKFRELLMLPRDHSLNAILTHKVLFHENGVVTKIWKKRPRIFSSARFYPYDSRFVSHAELLQNKGIVTPKILFHGRLLNPSLRFVQYERLPGESVREVLSSNTKDINWMDLASFFCTLHDKGIFFRSIHFGNIIQLGGKAFGLIDFTDVTFYGHSLNLKQRARNLSFPLRYVEDVESMQGSSDPNLIACYLQLSSYPREDEKKFKRLINHDLL